MNFKDVFKRETKIIAVAVVCMGIVFLTGSYALFFKVNHNNNGQIVEAGALVIKYDNGNVLDLTSLTLDDDSCLQPMSDEKGLSEGCKFNLSVHNTGTLPMNYDLLIYDDTSSLTSGMTALDHQYIKYSLSKKVSNKNMSEDAFITVSDKKKLGDITEFNPDNKKILETSLIQSNETIEFTLKIWIDEDAPLEIIGDYIFLKLDVSGIVDGETDVATLFSDYLVNLAQTSSAMEKFSQSETSLVKSQDEYRYVGNVSNNYVCLSNSEVCEAENLFRIIGVMPTQSEVNGTYVRRVKLIKDTGLEASLWGENSDFSTSSVNVSNLNGSYLTSLGELANQYIASAVWFLGTSTTEEDALTSSFYVTPNLLYTAERSTIIYQGNANSYVGKIGLPYASDYAFSLGNSYKNEKVYELRNNFKTNSWFYKANDWLLDSNNTGNAVRFIAEDGSIMTGSFSEIKGVRPTLYLKENVKRMSGDGSKNNPYRLGV